MVGLVDSNCGKVVSTRNGRLDTGGERGELIGGKGFTEEKLFFSSSVEMFASSRGTTETLESYFREHVARANACKAFF